MQAELFSPTQRPCEFSLHEISFPTETRAQCPGMAGLAVSTPLRSKRWPMPSRPRRPMSLIDRGGAERRIYVGGLTVAA